MASITAHLPSPLIEGMRSARNAGLWAISPVDTAWRKVRGLNPLPPIPLRRHAGRASIFEAAALQMSDAITRLDLLKPDSVVLDAGCGCGAMALQWEKSMGPNFRYIGFDVHELSIEWCRKHFRHDKRFSFEFADVESSYGNSTVPLSEFSFPVESGSIDFELAKSLFTHLVPDETKYYLAQTQRVLAPGGKALLTAFLFDDTDPNFVTPAFPFGDPHLPVRWRLQARPAAAIAYGRQYFTQLVEDAGLKVVQIEASYWPGNDAVPQGQDYVIVTPA